MTDPAPIRSGIVGAGFMGEVHARAVRNVGGVVEAVATSRPEFAVDAARRLGANRAAESDVEVIESDEIDLVHVCTPNVHHASIAARALKAGKPVICEKPLALSVEDAQRLCELASSAEVVTAVPFVYRFYPLVRDARARVARGDVGSLKLLHGSYLQDWMSDESDMNWRVDAALGGPSRAFADIGVHWCDLIEFMTGHRIQRVSSRLLTAHARRGADRAVEVANEDAATVQFETNKGAIGSVVVSQVSPGSKNRLLVSLDGTEATLLFNQELPESLWVGRRTTNEYVARCPSSLAAAAARYSILPPGHPQGYQDCFSAFVADVHASMRNGAIDGLPTFADGLRAARIVEAVLRSAVSETWIEVDE